MEKVQGSSLLPVRVERKITLLARNLHLYEVQHTRSMCLLAWPVMSSINRNVLCVQDTELDYVCVLVIEEQTVVVDAYVETDDMDPSSSDITCQLHQVCEWLTVCQCE